MQIDFHHAVVYVIARWAGFAHRQADIIAYSSQYVDDATNSGTILFDNGAMYTRYSSAHKTLDYRNFSDLENHHVWIPFHFLPANGGKPAGDNPNGTFIRKIVCRPDSKVARQMIEACIADRHKSYGLHRLGVTLHVCADTWSHQDFAGVCHQVNHITLLDDGDEPDEGFLDRLKDFFGDMLDRATNTFLGDVLPLGHGAALNCPDIPFLEWRFKDCDGKKVTRRNAEIYARAAHEMCKVMQRFQAGTCDANVPGLSVAQRDQISGLLMQITDKNGYERHKEWIKRIAKGEFGFPSVKLEYKEKGKGSWKHQALGTTRKKDRKDEVFPYSPSFLTSDWKMFHDALMAHRFSVIYDILPQYGICSG